jgi:hypothetical protein
MKGNNTLILCEAQMIEIVQQWIDENGPPGAKVGSVKASSGSSHYALNGFMITLDEKTPNTPLSMQDDGLGSP